MFALLAAGNMYLLFVGACLTLWYYLTSTFNYWKHRGIEFRRPIPIFGNFVGFLLRIKPLHRFFYDEYTHFEGLPFAGLFVMRTPWLLIRDPQLIHAVMVTDFHCFPERINNMFYPHKKLNPLSVHLLNETGDRWRSMRKKFLSIVSPSRIKLMQSPILDCLSRWNAYVDGRVSEEHGEYDLGSLYENLTINLIGAYAFSMDCNQSDLHEKIRALGNVTVRPTFTQLLVLFAPKMLRSIFQLTDFPTDATNFYKKLVLDMIAYRRQNRIVMNDLLQLLMDFQNMCGDVEYLSADSRKNILGDERFDEIDIVGNSFLFITTFESVALIIVSCLYELALNRSIQSELRNEVDAAYIKADRVFSIDMVKDLKYLDAVVSETMRRYPPNPVLTRICNQDYRLPNSDKIIKRGIGVVIPLWAIHHDEKYFPDPKRFDPNRFHNKPKPHNGTYLPFGMGPRMCLGYQYALTAVKIAIANAVLRYEFAPCSRTQIPLSFDKGVFSLSPANGVWLNIKKRAIVELA